MASYHCPFCPFSDQDSSFLIQHVELSHPENGDSPFIPEDDNNENLSRQNVEASFGARDTLSDGGYFECECGETGRIALRKIDTPTTDLGLNRFQCCCPKSLAIQIYIWPRVWLLRMRRVSRMRGQLYCPMNILHMPMRVLFRMTGPVLPRPCPLLSIRCRQQPRGQACRAASLMVSRTGRTWCLAHRHLQPERRQPRQSKNMHKDSV